MTTATIPLSRVEGREKVTGAARYAYEYPAEQLAYAAVIQAAVAKGEIRSVNPEAALALDGVLAVLWCENAPKLKSEGELAVLQSRRVAYRGQIVAAVVAETLEVARHAQRLVEIQYAEQPHDVELSASHPRLYKPDKVNPNQETDTEHGDFDSAFAQAEISVDVTYETPWFHNNPMEPHATLAVWGADCGLTLYDSTQGATPTQETVAKAFGLDPSQVRVVSPHVGGGFGAKGTPRPLVILAAMAARAVGRPVKVAATRQEMFAFTGYRTPTIQRLRLGADPDGRLVAIGHDVVEQTSTVDEFAEQTATATRMMYWADARRTTHRLAALDVPTPSWMRAPGECPGMYALEVAMDELAGACGIDPIELRLRNEPDIDPDTGHPFSSRNLIACLREGARLFGWEDRDPTPRARRDGNWLVGTGVAASTYPARRRPSQALARRTGEDYEVRVAAADIGTGARTALTQIAADTLGVSPSKVRVEVGDSSFPSAPVAGGSAGTASWGSAVVKACRQLAERDGDAEVRVDTSEEIEAQEALSRHGFGAQFVEARVNRLTGEVRVSRLLGVFAVGRIINEKLARSQLIGGMTMGLGMALLEEGILDPAFGDVANHDLATYHVPTYADVDDIRAVWVEDEDPNLNPMGTKGIGEIGIVGTAAAITGAIYHATGHRFRRLPIRLDQVITALG